LQYKHVAPFFIIFSLSSGVNRDAGASMKGLQCQREIVGPHSAVIPLHQRQHKTAPHSHRDTMASECDGITRWGPSLSRCEMQLGASNAIIRHFLLAAYPNWPGAASSREAAWLLWQSLNLLAGSLAPSGDLSRISAAKSKAALSENRTWALLSLLACSFLDWRLSKLRSMPPQHLEPSFCPLSSHCLATFVLIGFRPLLLQCSQCDAQVPGEEGGSQLRQNI